MISSNGIKKYFSTIFLIEQDSTLNPFGIILGLVKIGTLLENSPSTIKPSWYKDAFSKKLVFDTKNW